MRYGAVISREDRHVFADFPDCEGCHTFAEKGQDIAARAKEAVESWLEACLAQGEVPPRPSRPRGEVLWVDVDPDLSLKLQFRAAREAAGMSQVELAKRAGVSQQMIAKLESPKYHPRIDSLEGIVRALGYRLSVKLEPLAGEAVRSPAKKRDLLPIAAKRDRRRARA